MTKTNAVITVLLFSFFFVSNNALYSQGPMNCWWCIGANCHNCWGQDDPWGDTDPNQAITGGNGSGGNQTSCTVTSNCYDQLHSLHVSGSVSCTGTICSRGHQWVECDGIRTEC